MKKYIMVSATFFKAQIAYRFNVFMGILELLGRILFAWIIWSAVFSEKGLINGFSFEAMLFYHIASSFLASLDTSSSICSNVSSAIRGGEFSKQMLIPMEPQAYFCAQVLGVAGYNAIFSIIAIAIVAFTTGTDLIITKNPLSLIFAVMTIPLGIICMVCYYYFIGLTAFKFQDVGFFLYIQWTVRDFLTGSMLPLFLLPAGLLQVANLLPFPHVVYTPVMLLMGKCSLSEGLMGFCILSIWTIVLWIVNIIMYNKLRIKYDGVGI